MRYHAAMPFYRCSFFPGGSFFFTANLGVKCCLFGGVDFLAEWFGGGVDYRVALSCIAREGAA